MLSEKHEQIVDDIREALTSRYTRLKGTPEMPWDVMFATDGWFANTLMGLKGNKNIRADFYIFPDDGGMPIVVEIGKNDPKKWEGVRDVKTGTQIRILYVSFERAFILKHGIGSDFERDMLEQLKMIQSM